MSLSSETLPTVAPLALVASGALIALVDDYRAVFAMGVVPVLASVVLLVVLRAPPVRRARSRFGYSSATGGRSRSAI